MSSKVGVEGGGGGGDDGRTKGRRVEVKGERKKQEIVWLTKKSDI